MPYHNRDPKRDHNLPATQMEGLELMRNNSAKAGELPGRNLLQAAPKADPLLAGSWYLLANFKFNSTYNSNNNHVRALKGPIRGL